MGFAGRDLITINDFTNKEIETVLDLADRMNSILEEGKQIQLCKGMDMATLFYEPSTRTRGSFERAMHKLGGEVVSFAEAQTNSSAAKGETIADTVRVLENYADIIVIRHPWEGAAKVAADYAHVPVINAGDGAHEHPTQTLCDLYAIRKEKGRIKDLTIALWGDLKYGRTVHSLIYALARFGAEIFCAPVQDLDMPKEVLHRLRSEYNCVPKKVKPDNLKSMDGIVDALYIAPFKSYQYQMALFSDLHVETAVEMDIAEAVGKVEALYVTRIQTERRGKSGAGVQSRKSYPTVDSKFLGDFKKKTLVMHPLPRVDELSYELDQYPTSAYFRQAAYGVPIRMALTALLLGVSEITASEERDPFNDNKLYEKCNEVFGVECLNPDCVSNHERERRYISPKFNMLKGKPLTLRCIYCEHEIHPPYIASSEWHQGRLENRKYHSADSHWAKKIRPENLIIFNSESEAEAHGFKPSHYARARQ